MIHPHTGATIVSVGELKRFLEANAFSDDSPVGILPVTEEGRPAPAQRIRFPGRISLAKGHGLPDMLVLSMPPLPASPPTAAEIATLQNWVSAGMPDGVCTPDAGMPDAGPAPVTCQGTQTQPPLTSALHWALASTSKSIRVPSAEK